MGGGLMDHMDNPTARPVEAYEDGHDPTQPRPRSKVRIVIYKDGYMVDERNLESDEFEDEFEAEEFIVEMGAVLRQHLNVRRDS
jgi:hypothetical protein